MLAIRLQRTGRKGHAHYRVIVQEQRRTPTSGRVVAYVGSYDPHTKTTTLKSEKIQFYLDNGAQPSERVAGILKNEGIKLPKWVTFSDPKERATRNPEKLRKNQPEKPAEEAKEEAPEADTEEKPAEEPAAEAPAEEQAEAKADEKPAEEAEQKPADKE